MEKQHLKNGDPVGDRQIWRSSDVEPHRGFEYYRDGICQSFMDLIPEPEGDDGWDFSGSIETMPIGAGRLNRVVATSHLVRRTWAEIANSPDECYYLNYKTRGECRISQSGDEVAIRSGDVGLFDSTMPFQLEHRCFPDLAVSSFMLSHDALRERLGGRLPTKPMVLSHHTNLGPLIRETAATLAREAEILSRRETDRLYDILFDLVAMAVSVDENARTDRASSRAEAMLLLVKNYVNENHRNANLNASAVAAASGISVRYLHTLFARTETSFGEYLLTRRLQSAASSLRSSELARQSIATIALQNGFNDPAHFYRKFKSRYGCTAREWRVHQRRCS